ncbi:unnamed protein product [Cuscuta epithymum]|uniref:RNase H type-1 domain-containing protein n=1 Tax=Cuscuta epithymum TaxID=186058 RepID=A0AAV0DWE5_9ASTE|nr:unnamed protein product [Cuscuta epithymum]CAH9133966.1 unnamed protein product [Cuscuta epithymum]
MAPLMITGAEESGTGVARHHDDNFMGGGWDSCRADWPIRITETIGVREALAWAKRKGWDRVILETDGQVDTTTLEGENGNFYFDVVMEDIKQLYSGASFSASYCKRSSNRAVHSLS